MRIKLYAVILFVFSSVISYAQEMTSEQVWDDFVKAVNSDYVDTQVKQIDLDISTLYNRLDSKCTNDLIESVKIDISKLSDNKFIIEEQHKSLNKLNQLLDNYRAIADSFKSIFVQTVDNQIVNTLLKMETIDSQQAFMMAKVFWNIYEPKVKDLTYPAEYIYLNTKLNRFREIFVMITTQDPSLQAEAYLDTLQEALRIESELIEEHTTYFKIR